MKVELASGYHPDMNYDVHIDLNPNCPHLEYVHSADHLEMFKDNSIEAIRASDILEHFSYRDTIKVLAEWRRVLVPGGEIYIQTPDAKLIAQRWLSGDLPQMGKMPVDFSASYWIMGGHLDDNFARQGDDFRWNAHYALFSPESMEFYLKTAGFSSWKIKSDGGSNMMIWAYK